MKKSAFDVQHPIFRPLWLRVLIIFICFAWGTYELTLGNYFWVLLFAGCGLYLAYEWLVAFNPEDPDEKDDT